MEILTDIVYAITRYQAREIDVLTNPRKRPAKQDNRYWEFYVGLRENRWKTDEEAARHFGLEYPGKNYNRLKNETIKRLLNSVLFTDVNSPDFNDYKQANQELVRLWAIAEVLRKKGAHRAFLEVAEKCLSYAVKFEHVEMVVSIARMIRHSTLPRPNRRKEYNRAKELFEQYWPAYLAEVDIQNGYESLVSHLVTHRGYKKEYAPLAQRLVAQHAENAGRFLYIHYQFHYRILGVYAKVLQHDWAGGLQVADEALAFFNAKPFKATLYLLAFSHQKMACLTMLGRYAEAKETVKKTLPIAVEGSSLWFKTHELSTVNALYAKNYTEAWQITKNAIHHGRFSEISVFDQEAWRVCQGYLLFLGRMKKLALSPREKGGLPKFRRYAWLNDLPLFSMDKRGGNIPVLILQALFLILEKRWDEFDCRLEALRKYCRRNLDLKSEHFRTDCFIHLLELVPRYSHALPLLHETAQPWLKKMESVSGDILDRTFEIEVAPYEQQWTWIVEALEFPQLFEEEEVPYGFDGAGAEKEGAGDFGDFSGLPSSEEDESAGFFLEGAGSW